jgi:hypothetical protein
MWWRYVLIFVAGGLVMYMILSYLKNRNASSDASWLAMKKLINTQQFANLVRTNEFREIVKMKEFRDVILTLAEDQVLTVANTLQG